MSIASQPLSLGREGEREARGGGTGRAAAGGRELAIVMVHRDVLRDGDLPTVSIGQKLLLVVEQLLVGLCGEFKVRTLHDGINRTGLGTVAAVDALGHVNIITHCASAAVGTSERVDGDGLQDNEREGHQ
jgi:hypothetical protein